MAYDKSLDKNLFSETVEFETARITVGVYSYNDGEKKLQMARETRTMDGEWKFDKLGRLFKDEVKAILPIIKKALEHM